MTTRRNFIAGAGTLAGAITGSSAAPPDVARKPHLRTAICAYSFRTELAKGTMKYEDLIQLAADLGVDGVDLTVYWLPPGAPAEYLSSLRHLAYRCGIDIYSIGVRVRLCQPTPELRATEVNQLRGWLDVAEHIGARHVRIFGGSTPPSATDDQAVDWAGETFRQCAALAAPRGFFLGVEDDGALTEDSGRLIRMAKQADSPWAGICLDIGNFKANAFRQVEACLPLAVNMHLKTEMRDTNGPQPTDWDRLFAMVAPVYRGYVALEYESSAAPARTAVPQFIAKIQAAVRTYSS